jgi:hypothetical protein
MGDVDKLFNVDEVERNIQLETIYKFLLSDLDSDFSEMIAAYFLLVLKLDGVVGKDIKKQDMRMVESMKQKLFTDKSMHKEMIEQLKKIKDLESGDVH